MIRVQIKDLVGKPGAMREQTIEHTLTEPLGTDVIAVPEGAVVELPLRLESVHEGILITANLKAKAEGECSRCLEPVQYEVDAEIQELFHYRPETEEDLPIEQDSLDLEQPIIDAVVLSLPIKPLCSESCGGICPGCGEKLSEDEEHDHEGPVDPRFDALKDFGA